MVRDWVKGQKVPAYKRFFCARPTAQPFGPTAIGGRGLALLRPAWIDFPGSEEDFTLSLFHVFVTTIVANACHTPMEYMGDYTIAPLQQPGHIDWSLLSQTVRSSCFILCGSDDIPA